MQKIEIKRLEAVLTAAKADHRMETYPARHRWVLRDAPVYDEAAAERHWRTLPQLFGEVIKRDAAA
jgi:carboxymethylenebutenolidase